MARDRSNPEQMCVSQPGLTHSVSAFGRGIHAWISRAVSFLIKWNTANPSWSHPGETYTRQPGRRYEIYTEDIGPVGLGNIETLLARYQQRIPGSTMHLGLIGRDAGETEKSLLIQIISADEEAVLEIAAEIRRHNGQAWMGIYITSGTFVTIKGPKLPVVNLADNPQAAASELESLSNNLLAS
jgi:hypothetical protein